MKITSKVPGSNLQEQVPCLSCARTTGPPYANRIWGIWGSYNDVPQAMFYLLMGDYNATPHNVPRQLSPSQFVKLRNRLGKTAAKQAGLEYFKLSQNPTHRKPTALNFI